MKFTEALKSKRVVILVGAGGVGKTTSSIIVALLGAKIGKRVALLSIDPAKRLAKALGIEFGNELHPIKLPPHIKGTLHATMLDQKAVFDDMIMRYAPSHEKADQILNNAIYKAVSTGLGGPLEYMAIAKLQQLVESDKYDLVVLGTPPDTHALEFLRVPNALAEYMDKKVSTWLLKPFAMANKLGLGKLVSASEKLMGGIAQVAGTNTLKLFAEFYVIIEDVLQGFNAYGENISKTLKNQSSAFVIVSVPTPTADRSFQLLLSLLKESQFNCDFVVLNRGVDPEFIDKISELERNDASEQERILAKRIRGETMIENKIKEKLAKSGQSTSVIHIPESSVELNSLEGLLSLADTWEKLT